MAKMSENCPMLKLNYKIILQLNWKSAIWHLSLENMHSFPSTIGQSHDCTAPQSKWWVAIFIKHFTIVRWCNGKKADVLGISHFLPCNSDWMVYLIFHDHLKGLFFGQNLHYLTELLLVTSGMAKDKNCAKSRQLGKS